MQIHHEVHQNGGRYVTRPEPGKPEAELTYSNRGKGEISIDHTGVPEIYRGQGIAAALVTRAVEDAREKGLKIIPRCSYAEAQFRRHPDWQDVRA